MTEAQKASMPTEELVVELMTSRYSLTGGRAEAVRLLRELRAQWGREIANLQWTTHNESGYHMGLPCRPEYECGVHKIIELAETAEVAE